MKHLICVVIICMFSCGTAKIAEYKVGANDVADIQLELRKNKKFIIQFKVLDEQPPKKYEFKGKWSENGNTIRLNFKLDKDDLPDLYALFDPRLDESKTIKIIDKKTVEFKKGSKRIVVWGLQIEKSTEKKK
jgi:hypothetical protein